MNFQSIREKMKWAPLLAEPVQGSSQHSTLGRSDSDSSALRGLCQCGSQCNTNSNPKRYMITETTTQDYHHIE
jgi:hypothetical protein